MILELLTARQPRYVVAETEDETAADFTAAWDSWYTVWARMPPVLSCSAVSTRLKSQKMRIKKYNT